MSKLLISFFVVFSLVTSNVIAGPDVADVRTSGKMKNQIYFFIDGSKMHVLYPYNYLGDGNPLKKRAIEAVEVHYRELLASWLSFYLDFTGEKNLDLRSALKDVSIEGRKKAQKMLLNKPIDRKDPLALMERAYQVAGEQIRAAGQSGTITGNKNFIDQSMAEYSKQQAYLMNSTIDFRKLFEQNLSQFDKYHPFENWENSDVSRLYPDFILIQFYGHWRTSWIKNLQTNNTKFANKHPTWGNLIKFMTKSVFEASKFRLSFVFRPWVHTTYDFNTGEVTNKLPYMEKGTYLWYNMALFNKAIKDDVFLRAGFGGINGKFDNVSEMDSFMTGVSGNVGALNIKAGILAPLSPNIAGIFDYTKYLGEGEGFGYYYLVGYQKGMLYQTVEMGDDPKSSGKTTIGNGGIITAQNDTPQDPKKKPKGPLRKSHGNLDGVVFKNLSATMEQLGADYSGLSQQLLQLLNLSKPNQPTNPGAGCWRINPGTGILINTCGGTPGVGIPTIPTGNSDYGLYYKNLGSALSVLDQSVASRYVEALPANSRKALIDAHFDYGEANYYEADSTENVLKIINSENK